MQWTPRLSKSCGVTDTNISFLNSNHFFHWKERNKNWAFFHIVFKTLWNLKMGRSFKHRVHFLGVFTCELPSQSRSWKGQFLRKEAEVGPERESKLMRIIFNFLPHLKDFKDSGFMLTILFVWFDLSLPFWVLMYWTQYKMVLFSIFLLCFSRGLARRPPVQVIEQLQQLNKVIKLGHMFCKSRDPDFLLDVIHQQVIWHLRFIV